MSSISRKISGLLFFLVLCLLQSRAQEEMPLPPGEEIVDSAIISPPDTSGYVDDEERQVEDDTLYFNTKDYPGIYDSTAIEYRSVPDSVIMALKADPDFWYADKAKQKKEQKDIKVNGSFLEKLFRFLGNIVNLLWILLALIVLAAVIWFLSNNRINVFGRSRKAVYQSNAGTDEQLMQPEDLQLAITNAVANHNYRMAVRLQYIYLLKKMSESGQIKFKEDTTNMQYLMQVFGKPYYKDFFTVTRHYEYVWYGEMPIDATLYKTVESEFNSLLNHSAIQS